MEEEKKDKGVGDLSKMFLKETLERQRNEMMGKFSQILWQVSLEEKSSSSSNFRGATPFKVHVNFDNPIFEGQIDTNAIDKLLNLLEGYRSVHNFSYKEKITFSLLKVIPPHQGLVGNLL